MALNVEIRKIAQLPVIVLSGRAVDVDVKKLAKALDSLYKKKSEKIVVDVTKTDFVDSHGLGTIVYYHTLLQKEGRQLVLLNSNPNVNSYLHRLFELTHLNKVLCIANSEAAVLEIGPRPMPRTAGFVAH